jgi:hypothetical protein
MTAEHIWMVLTFGCVGWYLIVTVYVAIQGTFDIRSMLTNLSSRRSDPDKP